MKPSKFWMEAGFLMIYGQSIDASKHQHHAIQIVWPDKDSIIYIGDHTESQTIVIDAGINHRLHLQRGWVILIEPQSTAGERLKLWLHQEDYKIIEKVTPFEVSDDEIKNPQHLTPLLTELGINELINEFVNEGLDPRISSLQAKLNQCFNQDCIKPEKWLAADVAGDLALSESRFLHLFKQEMNIAWRPYLLWRRLLCAISYMNTGGSATQAAYQAGFSDSSHLSRTFKNMFGLSIRQAQTHFKTP